MLSYSHTKKHRSHWYCLCDCGVIVIKSRDTFRPGRVCACEDCTKKRTRIICSRFGEESPSFKHGHAVGHKHSPTFTSWAAMLNRCGNLMDTRYHRYGGRGITVCSRWRDSFPLFLEDMGERPPGLTLDRIDNNGDYTPQNCRWATNDEQMNNTSQSCRILFNGRMQTVTQWGKELGIPRETLFSRLKKGRSLEEVFSQAHLTRERKNKKEQ